MIVNCHNDASGTKIHAVTGNAVVTEDGLFCSQVCATQAEDDRYYRNACEDRDSWYWEMHTPPWNV